jgi:two-component system sensor histidine kinase/response regulator
VNGYSSDELLASLLRLAEGCSVLYVEDEPEIRLEMTEMFESLFPRVVTAENGAQALERFRQEDFVLVITDINMPVLTGIEFIEAVRQTHPQQAILVTSAYSDSANLIPLINLGIGSFILKPLNWKMMLSTVHKELSSALAFRQEALYQERLEREVQQRTEELREAQQQVLRLQEAKNNMLALISHELRTPLNGILGFVELVRTSVPEGEGQVFLDHVEESAQRLERSTRKALDFASLSTGKRELHRDLYRIDALLSGALEQVPDRKAQGRELNYRWEGDSEGTLFTDAELAVEVLKNLFENTLKYAGSDPEVTVEFHREGKWEQLSFRDSGPGFPGALLDSLFQPFSTGNIMHHSEGMGLGLALVDVMMLTLGGRVEASNPPLGGAEVRLCFPVPNSLSDLSVGHPEPRPGTSGRRPFAPS